ncbi:DUF308 domain-containing protein [Microbacterium resistens]|uniref:DUF308 domain-containing protein n=1 Tax=Microbacterium resistens TaxID=156977 RepID=A0ABY3RWM7_9MICO|nr:DUF308 domain-containing protein [Microbacterium resistens]UGS27395.1 DUF308 domain-containing protein [Microbacterium resistens]
MSDALSDAKSLVRSLRVFLAVSGVIALLSGLAILIWPAKSAVVVTGIFGVFLVIAGLVYIGLGLFTSGMGRGWARAGHVLLGALYVTAGVVAFLNPEAGTLGLALVVAIFIGVSWIFDGIVSLSLLGTDGTKVWTLLYALLSIAAGVVVLFSPLFAAVVLWWVLGISLVAIGLVQIIRAITIGKDAKDVSAALRDESV